MPLTAPAPPPDVHRFTTSGNKGSDYLREAVSEPAPEQTEPSRQGPGGPPPAAGISSPLDAPETSPSLRPPAPALAELPPPAEWGPFGATNEPTNPHPVRPHPSVDWAQGHPLEIQSTTQRIIHAPHTAARWPIVNALWNADDDRLRARGRRLGLCCSTPSLRLKGDGSPYAALQRCRDRLCPLCSDRRGKVAAGKTADLVATFNAPRFITFTTRARPDPLLLRLRHLIVAFQRLRQTPEWRSWVKGGIYALEVTWNPRAETWHPHLHVIADGEFIPHAKLRKLWQALTGDSFIVDVRAVPDRSKAAAYIARYVAKPQDVHKWPPERIREYAQTLHGARMLQPFGTALGIKLDADADPQDGKPSTHLVHGMALIRAAESGDGQAEWARTQLAGLGRDVAAAVGIDRKPGTLLYPTPDPEALGLALRICHRLALWFPDLPPALDFSTPQARETALRLALPVATQAPGDETGNGGGDDDGDLLTLFALAHDGAPFGCPSSDERAPTVKA